MFGFKPKVVEKECAYCKYHPKTEYGKTLMAEFQEIEKDMDNLLATEQCGMCKRFYPGDEFIVKGDRMCVYCFETGLDMVGDPEREEENV